MAARTSYVNAELEWAEAQLSTWKSYVDNHPLDKIEDRIEWRTTKTGTYPSVVATIESQGKFIQETMKNYLSLLEVVDKLREKEEKRIETRGNSKLSMMAEKHLKKRT